MTLHPLLLTLLRLMRGACAWALVGAALAQQAPAAAAGTVITTEQVRAELLAHAPDGAEAGKTVWVGLQLTHKPQWHTYWKNSGDSGLPTELTWTLPEGVSAGAIAWPLPRKIPIGNLANYGYEDTVLLPVPLTITPAYKPSLLSSGMELKLKANWLVCKLECIPEEGSFVLTLPARSSLANGAFDKALQSVPTPLKADRAGQVAIVDGRQIQLAVHGLPAAWQGRNLDFFPETPEVIATA
ncbi:MAG: protein-disulfide reductase DsbD domain-containing protein, partial [Burkholderiaceae bacterium]